MRYYNISGAFYLILCIKNSALVIVWVLVMCGRLWADVMLCLILSILADASIITAVDIGVHSVIIFSEIHVRGKEG